MNELDWNKMQGMIPVIMENAETNETLTLAYATKEALQKTVDTGYATFFSRREQKLWTKGETSGNTMAVKEILYDCDGDALIYRVIPNGPACHEGPQTCFYRELRR